MQAPEINTVMRHWRIIFFLWIILATLSSAIGLNAVIISPLHPLYLVLIAILPSTIFLIITLLTSHSLFSQVFLWLKSLIFKNQSQQKIQTGLPIKYIVQLISNTTWTTILTTTLFILFLKFTFQRFDFYLGNTFSNSQEATYWIVHILNFIPDQFNLINFNDQIIQASFIPHGLTDMDRSMWARWVITMIFFYGLLPRLLFLAYFGLRSYCYRKKMLHTHTELIKINVTDKAKEKPLLIRAPKERVKGSGCHKIAIDITDQIQLPSDVIKLNNIDDFQTFEQSLKQDNAQFLEVFVDGNLMPDRGVLRRIIRLSNLTEKVKIHVITHDPYQTDMWRQHLSPILVEGEIANYETE